MARRRESGFEVMCELAGRLPPAVSLALAVLSYFILHYISLQEVPTARGMEEGSKVVFGTLAQAVSRVAQYLVPLILLVGAGISHVRRKRRKALAEQTRARGEVGGLLDMSWREFESLVAEAFSQQGYQVKENRNAGSDGGVDLVLSKGTEDFLVQCKQWRAQKVGVEIVRELYGLMAARGATGGYVVTAGNFTEAARAFAEGRNIFLVDGQQLVDTLAARKSQVPSSISQAFLLCPLCGAAMVERTARKGQNAGQTFWGCSTFPACRGTRQMLE